jgi:hypothetical protein
MKNSPSNPVKQGALTIGGRVVQACGAVLLLAMGLAACSGGGGGAPSNVASYNVSVTEIVGEVVLKGLDNQTYRLTGSDQIQVTGDASGVTQLEVSKHPTNQLCSLSNSSSRVGAVASLSISCVTTPINDTGLTARCDAAVCSATDSGSGRDSAAAQLSKIGSGPAGFDYTRLCNNGKEEGKGDCPLNPTLGTAATQWGCTRDNVTGLVWRVGNFRETTGASAPGRYTHAEALSVIVGRSWCGRSSWRLPRADELQQLVNSAGEQSGAYLVTASRTWLPMLDYVARNSEDGVPPASVDEARRSGFWSDTTAPQFTAWAVLFGSGRVERRSREDLLRIAPVSAEDQTRDRRITEPNERWTSQVAGTVTDKQSRLMWMTCSLGRVWQGGTCSATGANLDFDFTSALGAVASANANSAVNRGYTDWRLPNRAELASLADYDTSGTAISPSATALSALRVDSQNGGEGATYWSSSWLQERTVESAYAVNFSDGSVSLNPDLASPLRVRLVRSAQ